MTNIQLAALLCFVASIILLLKNLNWSIIASQRTIQHLMFGATVSVFLLWLFRIELTLGLPMHFMWLTALTLLLGLRHAIFSATAALFCVSLLGTEPWAMFGINGLFGVLLPICTSYGVYLVISKFFKQKLWAYLLGCGFVAGMLHITIKVYLMYFYFQWEDLFPLEVLQRDYLNVWSHFVLYEGMFNAMTLAVIISFKPHWLYTYERSKA